MIPHGWCSTISASISVQAARNPPPEGFTRRGTTHPFHTRGTRVHIQRSSCDEISFCHDVHAGLQDVSSPAEASAATLTPSVAGVSLKATHTAEEPHTLGDGETMAVTLQMTPKAVVSLFFFFFLACSLPQVDAALLCGIFFMSDLRSQTLILTLKVTRIYCCSFFFAQNPAEHCFQRSK